MPATTDEETAIVSPSTEEIVPLLDASVGPWAARVERPAAALLRLGLQLTLRRMWSPDVSFGLQRFAAHQVARLTLSPAGAEHRPSVVAGVPGEWAQVRGEAPPAGVPPPVLLYVHGGAFCTCSPRTHRAITGNLALLTGLRVFVVDYRLAPEHPFPAALDDLVAVYEALRKDGPLVVAGDSCGGGLGLSLALTLRDRGAPLPVALVLFSPWADLASRRQPGSEPPGEALLSVPWLAACAQHYLGNEDPAGPLVSPLHGDLRDLPPTLIQAGTDELLHDEALRLRAAMSAAGVEVRCEITKERWHVFQLHAGVLPSATLALRRVAAFLKPRLLGCGG